MKGIFWFIGLLVGMYILYRILPDLYDLAIVIPFLVIPVVVIALQMEGKIPRF